MKPTAKKKRIGAKNLKMIPLAEIEKMVKDNKRMNQCGEDSCYYCRGRSDQCATILRALRARAK